MEHLYNSVFRVERMQLIQVDGQAIMDWDQATDPDERLNWMLGNLKGRLDLLFIRPGKDAPPAVEAGRAQDRQGLLLTYPYAPIKSGDRIVAIPDAKGNIEVDGTFEIKAIPDKAIGFSSAHHLEVQVFETNQRLADMWPGEEDLEPGSTGGANLDELEEMLP
jgi:hypothetical protein